MISYQVAKDLYLVKQVLPALESSKKLPPRVHRLFVCDVSASMSGDLPGLRRHLKTRLDEVIPADDTITIIWFSGRGEFGQVVQAVQVRNEKDRKELFDAIDLRLRPVGLTGFKEPLEEVARTIKALKSVNPDCVYALTFMSDGHDNQWSKADIMKAVSAIADDLVSSTVVEYGWYANRPLLIEMAEALNGEYAFARDMRGFAPLLDASLSKSAGGAVRRQVSLACSPYHGVAFGVSDTGLVTWRPDAALSIRVPADVDEVWMLSQKPVGDIVKVVDARVLPSQDVTGFYAAAAFLNQRMLSDDLLSVLGALGDVAMVNRFAACFGKQQYSDFRDALMDAAKDASLRWSEGWDPNALPADDAFTVLDLLAVLNAPGNLLHVSHPEWSYSPIGRKTVFSGDKLSDEDKEALQNAVFNAARAGDLDAVKAAVADAEAKAVKAYKFVMTNEGGVPMTNLVLHESRPNVSIQTKQDGYLEIGEDGKAYGLPEQLPTHRFRNYAVLRDGIVNVEKLPVSLTKSSHAVLAGRGLVSGAWREGEVYVITVKGLPVINRRMVRNAVTGAKTLFALEWDLLKAQAAQKVWKEFQARHAPKDRTAGLEGKYGAEAAAWLKEIGVTDGGYNPKRAVAEVSDMYIGRELKVSIKGFSSLPKVADAEEAMETQKKVTPSKAIMFPALREAQDAVGRLSGDALTARITERTNYWIAEARRINAMLAEIKFAVVVGQVWFKEFESLDEGTLEMTDADGTTYTATVQLKEIEVKI
jgi:hypothetical protein